PGERPDELDVTMTIEALIMTGAEKRDYLQPGPDKRMLALEVLVGLRRGPIGLGFVPWVAGPTGPLGPPILAEPPRQYASISGKNIFFGNASLSSPDRTKEIDASPFTFLIYIGGNSEDKPQAFLYDRYNNKKTRLRNSAGFDLFPLVQDAEHRTLIHGAVVQMGDRDVVFRVKVRASEPES